MQNELEAKLAEITTAIAELENDNEVETAYYLGRINTLIDMKEWLEGMIANFCE
jgi:hypothetical protein